MKHEELLKRAEALGYDGSEKHGDTDACRTLAEIVISRDPGLWSAFPALLANSARQGGFKSDAVLGYLQGHEKDNFRALMLMSAALYKHLGLRLGWIKEAVAGFSRGALDGCLQKFRTGLPFNIGREQVFPAEALRQFRASFKKSEETLRRSAEAGEQIALELAMSRVFPPAQRRIFLKKINGEQLSKTEGEYFSRVIRKKTLALANPDLHRLARKVATADRKRA